VELPQERSKYASLGEILNTVRNRDVGAGVLEPRSEAQVNRFAAPTIADLRSQAVVKLNTMP
jgi:hypothetical protein